MKHRIPYTVPEGYFEKTRSGLELIPHMESRRPAMKLAPYLAAAAAICAVAVIGSNILNRPEAGPQESQEQEIVDYLISSGLTLAQLEEHFD